MKKISRQFILIVILICSLAVPAMMMRAMPSSAESKVREFSEEQTGASPEGFKCVYPSKQQSSQGALTIIDDKGNKVLAGLNGSPDRKTKRTGNFLALMDSAGFLDGELSARIKVISGAAHAEGGLIWRYRGAGDYLLFKYCASHNKVTLYSCINGYQSRIGVKSLKNINNGRFATWHVLKIKSKGGKIQCWFDGSPVFDVEDRTHQAAGLTGLFIGSGTVVYFDDLIDSPDDVKQQDAGRMPSGVTPWRAEIIDGGRDSGLYPSLAFDRKGFPAVAYYSKVMERGELALKSQNGWTIEHFEKLKGLEHFITLAFNRLNEPNLAFCYNSNDSAQSEENLGPYYAYMRDSKWNTAFSFDKGKNCYITMALDKNDYPRIAYLNTETRQIKLASWNGREWTIEAPIRLVRKIPDKGFRISLAINGKGSPCIAYFGPQYYSMNYMEKIDGRWIVEVIDRGSPGNNVGEFCSLALDSRDIPHLSYYDTGRRCLKYATKTKGNKWRISIADGDPGAGMYSNIATDRNDRPHVAYYDSKSGLVRYCTLENGKWRIVKTDCPGSFFSMKLASDGSPYIAFMDSRLRCLKLAHP